MINKQILNIVLLFSFIISFFLGLVIGLIYLFYPHISFVYTFIILILISFFALLFYISLEPRRFKKVKDDLSTYSSPYIDIVVKTYEKRVEEGIRKANAKQTIIDEKPFLVIKDYLGEENHEICMVCKLFIRKKEKISQCPLCESYFHHNHLTEWVKIKKKCPVCAYEFKHL